MRTCAHSFRTESFTLQKLLRQPNVMQPFSTAGKALTAGSRGKRIVAPEGVGKADRFLRVVVIVKPRRVDVGVSEAVVNGRKAGRARIGKPADLNRRRLAGENQETIPGHVHRQVDENVDPVLADERGDLLVGKSGDAPPDVGERTEPCGDLVWTSNIGVAVNLEVLVIVCGKKGHREKRHRHGRESRAKHSRFAAGGGKSSRSNVVG